VPLRIPENDYTRAGPDVRTPQIPHHLRLADLDTHRDQPTPRRVIITHMSADILGDDRATSFGQARDGLIVGL
jgi:hypothetical protein